MNVDTDGKALVDINPQPSLWPVCIAPQKRNDPTPCETPFVRRVGLSWTTGRRVWSWSRDCKHKGLDESVVRMEYQEPEPEDADRGSVSVDPDAA